MSSSLWTVVLVALLLPLSETTSASQALLRRNGNRVFIFQIPLQQLDPEISPRIPDSTTATEDSYLVALRESQINRNKVPVAAVGQHHHHHHEKGHHRDFVGDTAQQHHSTEVPATYDGHVLTTRPLTAMEKNYLRPHRPQLYKKDAVSPNSHIGELQHQSEDEETSEEVMETSASDIKVATLANTRSFSSVLDVNSIYSTYSSNAAARVVTNKPAPSIRRKSFEITETPVVKATSESGSEKPEENRKPIKKTFQIRVPEMVGVLTNRAANVVRNGMKTVGSTIGIPARNKLVGKVNSLLPIVAALSAGRKKRSVSDHEAKGWKDNIRTLGYMDFLAKLMNRPLWLQFTRSTNRPVDSIGNVVTTKAHSVVKRSTTNLKMKNFRATAAIERVIPAWLHSAFSRNKNRRRKESQVTQADITDENFMEENEVLNVERLTYSPSPAQSSEWGENETRKMEPNVEANVELGNKDKKNSASMPELKRYEFENDDKYTHGHGIVVVPPEEVPDSHEAIKDYDYESENETADAHNDEDESKYTHGHGIIVGNPIEDSNGFITGESSISETANNSDSNIENNNQSSVASPGDPYIATGIFGDEVDSELDDLESLMTDIYIAPLPVEAVVAEESVTESSLDPFDAVIIESAEVENTKPAVNPVLQVSAAPTIGLPVASNLANIFIAASTTSDSSQTSSSSSSSGSVSSGGITGSNVSAASVDHFASLYTFGLAAIGIFLLSLPIWVPIVATKRRRNKLIRNRSSSDFSSLSRYTDITEFNPYSILMRNLMPPNSEEPFSDPGPLKSVETYGTAASNFRDRRWRRR